MNDESAHPAEKGGLPTKEGLAAQTEQAGVAEGMEKRYADLRKAAGIKEYDTTHFESVSIIKEQRFRSSTLVDAICRQVEERNQQIRELKEAVKALREAALLIIEWEDRLRKDQEEKLKKCNFEEACDFTDGLSLSDWPR